MFSLHSSPSHSQSNSFRNGNTTMTTPCSNHRRFRLIAMLTVTYGVAIAFIISFFDDIHTPSESMEKQLRNNRQRQLETNNSAASHGYSQSSMLVEEEPVLYRPPQLINNIYSNIYSGTMPQPKVWDEKEATSKAKRSLHKVSPGMVSLNLLEEMVGHPIHRVSDKEAVKVLSDTQGPLPLQFKQKRVLYVITPTRNQKHQMLALTRLMQTLQLAAYTAPSSSVVIYWVVIEESFKSTLRIRELLESSGLPFAHVSRPSYRGHVFGDDQRNEGLTLVRELGAEGVVYFADEDNAYQTGLFGQLLETKRMGLVSVAFSGQGTYERCQADNATGRVQAVYSNRRSEDKLNVDLSSFAFTTELLLTRRPTLKDPILEKSRRRPSSLLEQLLMDKDQNLHELEALACDQPMAWHVVSNTPTEVLTVGGDEAASYLSLAV